MTAALDHIRWAEELPDLAFDPRVTVLTDLQPGDSDLCGVHPEPDRHCQHDEVPVPEGVWKIEFRLAAGHPIHWTWVCCASCCEDELADLLGHVMIHKPCEIVLRLPADWAFTSVLNGGA